MQAAITFYRPQEGWFNQTLRGELVAGCLAPAEEPGVNLAAAYSNLGLAWRRKKDYDSAIEAFTNAIQRDPKNFAAYANRGAAAFDKRELDRAIADFSRAIDLNPKFAFGYLARGIALSEDGLEQAGMGVAIGDFDLDGNIDVFKTNFADDTNVLYRNDGKGNFDDVTIRSGLGVETRYVGWGTGIADLDNDGLPDLFVTTGSVYPEVEKKVPTYPFRTPRLVFRNLGDGRFEELIEEAGPGVSDSHASRGCAFGDFDNDGDVDVLVWNMNEPPSLLRNDVSGGGHWLKVQLVGVRSNRSAIGSRVTARYANRLQAQEVTAQSSFYSANDRRLHFGLGAETTASLTIRWTNGQIETISNVLANQLVVVREGSGIIQTKRF